MTRENPVSEYNRASVDTFFIAKQNRTQMMSFFSSHPGMHCSTHTLLHLSCGPRYLVSLFLSFAVVVVALPRSLFRFFLTAFTVA